MIIPSKTVYRFHAIAIKLLMARFTELKQNFYNLYGNTKDSKEPKKSLFFFKKKKTSNLIFFHFISGLSVQQPDVRSLFPDQGLNKGSESAES